MFQKIIRMWDALLYRLGYERKAKEKRAIDPNVQRFDDTEHTNYLSMAVSKVTNLACAEATFEVITNSSFVKPLVDLCKDIENKALAIVYKMLGKGDCYVFPSTNRTGKLYHCVLDEERVVILNTDGENIIKACAILDTYKPNKSNKTFFLIRIHELDASGNLSITYDIIDEAGQPQYVDEWEHFRSEGTLFIGANHIGFGRYKSPVPTRGHSTVYGVPMNYGCGELEEKIKKSETATETEFDNTESRTFADPRNLRIAKEDATNNQYEMPKGIIPLRMTEGISNEIATHSPPIRYEEYRNRKNDLLAEYERQMGLSSGILTENQAMATGTATAVNRSNKDTISFVNSVRKSLDEGNRMTLEADSIFLNIRSDLWEYNSSYFDVFIDEQEQWTRLKEAFDSKVITREMLLQWLAPEMTDEQIAETLAKADEYNASAAQNAVMAALYQ